MSEETITDETTAENVTAWDATELERKGLANLTEEELEKYVAWKAKRQAQQLYNEQMAQQAEEAQKALEERASADLESAQTAFEKKVTEVMEKVQARLGGD